MTGREGPGPERPGPDYPPEWDDEPAEDDGELLAANRDAEESAPEHDLGAGDCEALDARTVFPSLSRSCRVCHPPAVTPDPWATQGPVPPPPF